MHANSISDSKSNSNLFTIRAHVVLTLCYLCWWSFLPPTSAFTLVAHVVLYITAPTVLVTRVVKDLAIVTLGT